MGVNFREKLGPFTYVEWIAGSVVLVLGYAFLKHHVSSTNGSGSVDTGLEVGSGSDAVDGLGDGTSTAGAVTTIGGVAPPTTDQAWAIQAADQLIGQGYDPGLVETTLSDYLAGNPLSVAEKAVMATVLKLFGTPPEGVIPVGVTSGTSGTNPAPGPIRDEWDQAHSPGFHPVVPRLPGFQPVAVNLPPGTPRHVADA